MAKIRKVNLSIHHGRYVPFPVRKQNFVTKFFKKIKDSILGFFFAIGMGVVKSIYFVASKIYFVFHTIFTWAKNDIIATRKFLPKRFARMLEPHYLKTIGIFLVFVVLGLGLLGSLGLLSKGLDLKDRILQKVNLGQGYLNQAKDSLAEGDAESANSNFALALESFRSGQQQMSESGEIINQILNLVPQKRDAERLLKAAGLVSSAGQDATQLQQILSGLKLGAGGLSVEGENTKNFFESFSGKLGEAVGKISEANNLVSNVNEKNLPENSREQFSELKEKLYIAHTTLSNFWEIFEVGQNLFVGDKNILIVFENNNEMRATGGFMGTYGNLKLRDGKITAIQVSSVYDLDGQLKEVIKPPRPILNVNDRLFLRDSNWFASWPKSAKEISALYEMEGGETPDVVVALTPNLVIDWLKITGPIALPKYNITLTAENFIEQIQAITTVSDGLPVNEPKQILADLFPLILQRIGETDEATWLLVIRALQDNLNGKQLVIFARDEKLQERLEKFNWDGGIKNIDRDYLSIVSSNLGGTKTDLAIDQKIKLTTTISKDGTLVNELEITRTNNMANLPSSENVSFLRIYAPEGSQLISSAGFNIKNLEFYPSKVYKIDSDIHEWEQNYAIESTTKTFVGKESGKTYFGNWLELQPGESKTVKLVYKLPFKLKTIDRYSLLLQKQIGSKADKFEWNAKFSGREIQWINFEPAFSDASSFNSDIILSSDTFFGIVFSKR